MEGNTGFLQLLQSVSGTLKEHSTLVETIGVILIFSSVLVLLWQIRINTQTLKSSIIQNAHDNIARFYLDLSANQESLAAFINGSENPGSLSRLGTGRLFSVYFHMLFTMQNLFIRNKATPGYESMQSPWISVLTEISGTPGFKQFWPERKHLFNEDFVTYVEDINKQEREKAKPGYRVLYWSIDLANNLDDAA